MPDGDGPRLQLLGPVSVLVDGVGVPSGGVTPRRLLAVLLVNRNTVLHIDQLCSALWGEDLPLTAVASLRSHVSRLRRSLPQGVVLESVVPGYRLRVQPGDVDIDRFEALLAVALAPERAEPMRALEALDAALNLWAGDALAEFADEWWAHGEAARLEELRLLAREARLDVLLALGRPERAVGDARHLTMHHPERERGWMALVRALTGSGRQREALRCAHDYRTLLRERWGLSPSPTFEALERAVAGNVAAAVSESPVRNGARVPDGTRIGSGAAVPSAERPLDVASRDLPCIGTQRGPSTDGRVPAALTRLVGRKEELAALLADLDARRLLTLTGVGGVGKTRLAVEVSSIAGAAFGDGVIWCELAPIAEPVAMRSSCWTIVSMSWTPPASWRPASPHRARRSHCWPPVESRSASPVNASGNWRR